MYSVNDRFLILEAFTEGKPLLDALSTETKHAANFLSGMTLEKSLEIDDAGDFWGNGVRATLLFCPEHAVKEQACNMTNIANVHAWFASAYAAFRTVGRSTGMPQHALYTDGIHPNRIGQVVLRRSLEQLLGL